MRCILIVPVLLAMNGLAGCSSAGSALGISSPQHRLLTEAKDFRERGPVPAAPRELAKTLLPAHILEPGDVMLVTVADLDSPIRIPSDQPVQPDGTIDLGKYGRPVVAGGTLAVAEETILNAVKAREKEVAGITVRMLNRVSKVIYVLGEVNAPGAFPITGRETALDAILTAGGLTRKAAEGKIILSRPTQPEGCRVVWPICYPQIVQLGDTTTNYQLQPGDRIFVPSRGLRDDLCPTKTSCPCAGQQVPCGTCATPASP